MLSVFGGGVFSVDCVFVCRPCWMVCVGVFAALRDREFTSVWCTGVCVCV